MKTIKSITTKALSATALSVALLNAFASKIIAAGGDTYTSAPYYEPVVPEDTGLAGVEIFTIAGYLIVLFAIVLFVNRYLILERIKKVL